MPMLELNSRINQRIISMYDSHFSLQFLASSFYGSRTIKMALKVSLVNFKTYTYLTFLYIKVRNRYRNVQTTKSLHIPIS
jgi:hypothetical protein